ncbi:protein adenylyltransferase SelO [Allosphingosinicella deserti]|uniref:Protein nucleotidyltransferase YdiU n=1 Tax=Allosphingosinicella deserti TaxID=2116704 RepID=A0A2P7QRF0_9SPHN|nr:YdiU family protein [Sphingomonas deserti]PSJ40556.1 YdiU family protein [Sphingomonas deserti]
MSVSIPFDNSYARLPERFYASVVPSAASAPRLIKLNRDLARELGLDPDALAGAEGVGILSGLHLAEGSQPIALAYAGHQFAHFVPQLGDGRAILLGEVIDLKGKRRDIHLKGSGRTPFSRGGDGKAALGPVLREYVVSEAMAALGVPTTRALAAVATGETVVRDALLPGAAIVRVAASHIRVGTFQFFAARDDAEGLRLLADHVIARHYPDAAAAPQRYRALLDGIVAAQADLVARWLLIGFIHGVMNTDNMAVSGETIDYGPCAFLDDYDPAKVFSSIDRMGRYAYGRQPEMALWNLTRLAETLLPLLADDEEAAIAEAQEALAGFAPAFEDAYLGGLRRKLGFATEQESDLALATNILQALAIAKVDFTNFFRGLADAQAPGDGEDRLRAMFDDPSSFDIWLVTWRARLAAESQGPGARREAMRAVNPAFIPRNHRIEAMIRAAVDDDNFGPFDELNAVLSRPYDDQPDLARYSEPPAEAERVTATFCGT